jgi:putative ABC transport system substrate-binding protein
MTLRKDLVVRVVLWSLLFALCVPAQAEQSGKIFRIGFLDNSTAAGSAILVDAFREELSKLGWIEGKNISMAYRFAEQKPDRVPELAADLVRLKVDLIVATGGGSSLAAKRATTTIPVVMTNTGDPVDLGLIASLARPGGNVTGLSSLSPDLNSKRLEVLKDTVSKLVRVGVLWPAGGGSVTDRQMKDLRGAAPALKLKLEEIETQVDPKGLENAFQTAEQKKVNAIMMTSNRVFFAERKTIVRLLPRLDCLFFIFRKSLSMRAVSCPMGSTMLIYIGVPPLTWTKFSKVQSQQTSLSNSQPNSS